jgi:hypothetical protein
MFFNTLGYLRFSSPVLWEPAHQLNELLGGGSGLRLWQRRAQLRHHLITHGDLNLSACVLSHLANQLGQSFACFADRQFHSDQVYKGVQTESTGEDQRFLTPFLGSAAATSVGAAKKLRDAGVISQDELVVCNLTGHGLKQPEAIQISEKEFAPIAPTLAALRE